MRAARSAVGLALLLACSVLLSRPARAQSVESIFAAANRAYVHGDYAAAAEQYQRLVDASVRDPDVYFNLGLAHARLGQIGVAVLNFERCLWLRPGDETAESELRAARALIGGRRAERDGEATVQALPPLSHSLVRPISSDVLAWTALIASALLFSALLIRTRMAAEAWRLGLAIAAPLLALIAIASGLGLLVKLEAFDDGEQVIVLHESAEVREGPDASAQVRGVAHEGDSARALRRDASFVELRLASGKRGWVADHDVGLVRPH